MNSSCRQSTTGGGKSTGSSMGSKSQKTSLALSFSSRWETWQFPFHLIILLYRLFCLGGSLRCYWFSSRAWPHEKRKGPAEAKGKNHNYFGGVAAKWMAGAKLTKILALTSLKVDIISLGTYLKRFNFRTHSKQVNIRDNLVKHWLRGGSKKNSISFGFLLKFKNELSWRFHIFCVLTEGGSPKKRHDNLHN